MSLPLHSKILQITNLPYSSRRTLEKKGTRGRGEGLNTHAHKSNFWTLNFEPQGTTMEESEDRNADVEASKYVHRKYERVPGLDEIDQSDFVALAKARDQWVRNR